MEISPHLSYIVLLVQANLNGLPVDTLSTSMHYHLWFAPILTDSILLA